MYDDIAYSKDDIRKRSIHILEYAVCMTTLRIGKTTRRHVVSMLRIRYIYMMTFHRENKIF